LGRFHGKKKVGAGVCGTGEEKWLDFSQHRKNVGKKKRREKEVVPSKRKKPTSVGDEKKWGGTVMCRDVEGGRNKKQEKQRRRPKSKKGKSQGEGKRLLHVLLRTE